MLTPKESPNYSKIHRNFKTYKNIIRRSIMLAKRDYYIKNFSKYSKNDPCVFMTHDMIVKSFW